MTKTKTERVAVYLTPEEAEYVRTTATDNNLTVSEFIHEVLVGFSD